MDARSGRARKFQTVDRMSAAGIAGLKPEQVQIHTTLLGGWFWFAARILPSDFVSEAVHVAKPRAHRSR